MTSITERVKIIKFLYLTSSLNELLQFYELLDDRILPLIFTLFLSCFGILSVELSLVTYPTSALQLTNMRPQTGNREKQRWKELKKLKYICTTEWFLSFTLIRIVSYHNQPQWLKPRIMPGYFNNFLSLKISTVKNGYNDYCY